MAKTANYRVLLLRTGATDWDLNDRVQGSTDLPLSETGGAEAAAAVAKLGRPPLTAVYCAPDEASVSTAEMLAAAAGVKAVPTPDFAEMAFGLWEGILKAELEDRFCRAGRLLSEDPTCVTPPEGECLGDYAERLFAALKKVLAKGRGRRAGTAASRGALIAPPGVGIVLRPVGDAVLRCAMAGLSGAEIPAMLRDKPGPRRDVPVSAA
jgi:broad specificity phosphatase PhoE